MRAVRHLIAQRHLALLLCAAALLLKLVVPAGYMIGSVHGAITFMPCSGVASRPMAMEMPGMNAAPAGHGKPSQHGRAEMPCAFSALSAAALGGVDAIQLAALIAFVVAIHRAIAVLPAPPSRRYLRPPLRGPPATA